MNEDRFKMSFKDYYRSVQPIDIFNMVGFGMVGIVLGIRLTAWFYLLLIVAVAYFFGIGKLHWCLNEMDKMLREARNLMAFCCICGNRLDVPDDTDSFVCQKCHTELFILNDGTTQPRAKDTL